MIESNIKKVLVSEEEIQKRVKELGKIITKDFKETKGLIVVGLLRGSILFMADLMREIKLPLKIDFMTVSSYGNQFETTREVKILKDLDENVMGKDILIVEDIIDSGLTLSKIMEILKNRNPNSIKLCTLLNKSARREVNIKADYIGFDIPDEFVLGYGLDYLQEYRNLPYVGVMKEDVNE
ncbi:hypoxanthine phosphoribosyltransferase [Haliovirga abyssi]|uniref:Hypoxanthine phosphoribosyltransferase n=1 Tax=Haliovirga abyssi TaxID=2996794 RepID=A0AAU9DDW7_9FUSO|nr:hypoxanthine phosphoribosyltransferase [Haliovirga abyssi]BDU50537.1 hypoxanthine phosphoribosyltransferase [Haliovirga abyssi]